jgi:hypothetical protein
MNGERQELCVFLFHVFHLIERSMPSGRGCYNLRKHIPWSVEIFAAERQKHAREPALPDGAQLTMVGMALSGLAAAVRKTKA